MSKLPDTMQAALYVEKGRLSVESWPVPEPGLRDVLLEVSHCGVCGTDLHMVMEGWGTPRSIGGHEYSGRVVAMGDEVEGWSLGDLAVGGGAPSCGHCEYCTMHRPSLCTGQQDPAMGDFQGAFAEYIRVGVDELVRIPATVSMRAAALAEPLAVALHGITLSGIQPGQGALITGAGPIGALVLAALRAKGIEAITVSEPSPVRRELARRLGAARVLTPDDLEIPKMPFQIGEGACEVAFECSGSGEALRACLAGLKKAGTCVILGTGLEHPRIDPNRILLNELSLTGGYTYDENGFHDALELLASGKLPVDDLIEPVDVGLTDLQAAMQNLVAGQTAGKVLVCPAGDTPKAKG